MFTKKWKVYGAPGHRQRVSFGPSIELFNGSVKIYNSDKTGTNEYSVVCVTCTTDSECDKVFLGQLTDGIFESARVGAVEEIK